MFKCNSFSSKSEDISLECLKFSLLKSCSCLSSSKIDTYNNFFVQLVTVGPIVTVYNLNVITTMWILMVISRDMLAQKNVNLNLNLICNIRSYINLQIFGSQSKFICGKIVPSGAKQWQGWNLDHHCCLFFLHCIK